MKAAQGKGEKKKSGFVRNLIYVCIVGLALGGAGIAAIVIPEFTKNKPVVVELKTAEQIAAEKVALAEAAEKDATWENYHCNLLHRYYKGPEDDLPQAELIGLGTMATEDEISDRCQQLLPAVRIMAGLPSSRPQQDNYVICEGFEFLLRGGGDLTIRPTRHDLARSVVMYGGKSGEMNYEQKLVEGQTIRVGEYVPIVTQADDQCVIVGVRRLRGVGGIPGSIVRTADSPQIRKSFFRD
jgi:hypothetical protein